MTSNALELVYGLPQAQHFPDSRVIGYLQRLQTLGEDTLWHVNRLNGFGGSEMGALLRHRFGDFAGLPDDSFKDAWEIVAEKLLRLFPRPSTPQAIRGRELEPLVRDAFRLKFRAVSDDANLPLTQHHSGIDCLNGNVDDLLLVKGELRILPDYKTSQERFASVPFDYRVQLHTYAAICQSNGVKIDGTMVVGLHAPENVLTGLRKIVAEREAQPKAYQRWVETLAFASVPGVELAVYPIKLNRDLIGAIENTAQFYWNQHVLEGKLLPAPVAKAIPEAVLPEIERYLAQGAHAIAAIKAAEQIQQAAAAKIVDLMQRVEVPLTEAKWPKNIGAPRVTANFDEAKAIAAAMANGIEPEAYTKRALSVERMKAKLTELGVDLNDDSLMESSIDNKKLLAAIAAKDMDQSLFQRPTMSITLSRSNQMKAAIDTAKEEWVDRLNETTQAAAIFETTADDEHDDELAQGQAPLALNPA